MRDVTKSHEKADWLRGYKPTGQYEAVYYDAQLDSHRTVGVILDYWTGHKGQKMMTVKRGDMYKYIAVESVTLVAPGM